VVIKDWEILLVESTSHMSLSDGQTDCVGETWRDKTHNQSEYTPTIWFPTQQKKRSKAHLDQEDQ
jgi:hypothetical protein